MADLQQMSRVLYHHDWANVEDWARNISKLADLSDDEIVQLECYGHHISVAGTRENTASVAEVHRSLMMRARERVATLCYGLRLGLRRAC